MPVSRTKIANRKKMISRTPVKVWQDFPSKTYTYESDVIKAVIGYQYYYKGLAAKSVNLNGGNIYQLYHKPTDPKCQVNLVNNSDTKAGWYDVHANWSVMTGAGGLGFQRIFIQNEEMGRVPDGVYADWRTHYQCNQKQNKLIQHGATILEDGSLVFKFHHVNGHYLPTEKHPDYGSSSPAYGTVDNEAWSIEGGDGDPQNPVDPSLEVPVFDVKKQWTISPEGVIQYDSVCTVLIDSYVAEPGINFGCFDADCGWQTCTKYGSMWGETEKISIVYDDWGLARDIDSTTKGPQNHITKYEHEMAVSAFDAASHNQFRPDWILLHDGEANKYIDNYTAPDVKITANGGYYGGVGEAIFMDELWKKDLDLNSQYLRETLHPGWTDEEARIGGGFGDMMEQGVWPVANGPYTVKEKAVTSFDADVVTVAGPTNPFSNGDKVILETSDTLPVNLEEYHWYYVINVSNLDLQLSHTQGGSAIEISDAGSGSHEIKTKMWVWDRPDLGVDMSFFWGVWGGNPPNFSGSQRFLKCDAGEGWTESYTIEIDPD